MEISGKVLREVEFRDRLRGYDTDEVDEFLEKVAVGIDELRAALEQATKRAERAERRAEEVAASGPSSAEPSIDDDAIRRTLVLAQRTADMAVSEAREEAARMLEEARTESELVMANAEESARRARDEAEQELHARLVRLAEERERLEREVQGLARLVESERSRLKDSLASALEIVTQTLTVSDALAERQATAPPPPAPAPAPAAPRPPEPVPSASLFEEAPHEAEPDPSLEEGSAPTSPQMSARQPEPAGSHLVPDVESEIAEDAATAYGGRRANGTPSLAKSTPPLRAVGSEEDAEEELWQRWAAGRDLGVVPGPSDFEGRGPRFGGRGPGSGGGLSA